MANKRKLNLAKPLQFWELKTGATATGLHLEKVRREEMVVFFVQKDYLAPTPGAHTCAFCGKNAEPPVDQQQIAIWSVACTNTGNQLACNGCANALESLEVPTNKTVLNTEHLEVPNKMVGKEEANG